MQFSGRLSSDVTCLARVYEEIVPGIHKKQHTVCVEHDLPNLITI